MNDITDLPAGQAGNTPDPSDTDTDDSDLDLDLGLPDEDAGTEDEPADDANLFTVKINGEEKKVTRDELIERYQKETAAGKKFEEAAEIRKQYAERARGLEQHERSLAGLIQQMDAQVRMWATEATPNWAELLEKDPHEYLRQKEVWAKRAQSFKQMRDAQAYQQELHSQRQAEALQEHLASEGSRLLEVIPEWKNEATRESERDELVADLYSRGYSDEDIQYLSHSRAENILLAREAMLYRKALARTKALKKSQAQPETALPIQPVGGSLKSKSSRSISDPDLPFDDFVKMRHAQIAKRR